MTTVRLSQRLTAFGPRQQRLLRKAIDFALYATVDPDEGAMRVGELIDVGAAAFKFSTFGTHPKRFPRIPPQMLYACFRLIGPRGLIAAIHNENDEMVLAFTAEVEGVVLPIIGQMVCRGRQLPKRWPTRKSLKSALVPAAQSILCIAPLHAGMN